MMAEFCAAKQYTNVAITPWAQRRRLVKYTIAKSAFVKVRVHSVVRAAVDVPA